MRGFGTASACASATVVNALATGRGAAFGIELRVYATVEVGSGLKGVKGKVMGSRMSPRLIELCVEKVLDRFGVSGVGTRVQTSSDIPVAVGLSSSSAAANAAVLATYAALGERPRKKEILKLGVDAALEVGVTLTGALDDAAGSLYGEGVVTHNLKRRVLKRFRVPEDLKVAIFVPGFRIFTSSLSKRDFSSIREGVDYAHRLALKGKIWDAMVLNGLLYSHALNLDPLPALEALSAGAVAAGLTGTGPATVAVGDLDSILKVVNTWKRRKGTIILTTPAQKGGRVERFERGAKAA